MFPPNVSEQHAPTRPVDEPGQILNGWKEIATFMGRGIRTVQRWEALGLPVRRPHGRPRSAVMAYTGELHTWMLNTPLRDADPNAEWKARVAQLEEENAALRLQLRLLHKLRRGGDEIPFPKPGRTEK